jgi:hypothetical protein
MYVLCMLRQLFGAVVCTCTRPTPLIGSESYNPHPSLSHPPPSPANGFGIRITPVHTAH